MTEAMFQKPNVKLIAYTQGKVGEYKIGPDDICAFSAAGCRDSRSLYQIILDAKNKLTSEEYQKEKEHYLNVSVGNAHLSVLDKANFEFSVEGLPRTVTLALCEPHFFSHLQQSQRFTSADKGCYFSENVKGTKLCEKTQKVLDQSFILYEQGDSSNIKMEDARYILPLGTKTNISTNGSAREFLYFDIMTEQETMPPIVRDTAKLMYEEITKVAPLISKKREKTREVLSFMPSSQLFGECNESLNNLIEKYNRPTKPVLIDTFDLDAITKKSMHRAVKERNMNELANLKSSGYVFLFPISLAGFHQGTRQRTWDHTVETAYDAVQRVAEYDNPTGPNDFSKYSLKHRVPPQLLHNEYGLDSYNQQTNKMFDLYDEWLDEGEPKQEAVNVLPHNLIIYDRVKIDMWNMIHSFRQRLCTTAQWEIRRITEQMLDEAIKKSPEYVSDILEEYIGTRCEIDKVCFESKPCAKFKA
ncbi:MAG: FAD-dependent thymidylate synthase [Nanoarchaeota archaeon]|nr:FAD-dependent thymidylate synthase [Nanoarchaeota archaeon]